MGKIIVILVLIFLLLIPALIFFSKGKSGFGCLSLILLGVVTILFYVNVFAGIVLYVIVFAVAALIRGD